jgi:diguanylate cyclase (GGDEF)-like protein
MDIATISSLASKLDVLYVEDDATLRIETGALLEEFFNQVFYTSDGLEGLEFYKENSTKIDLVITDINMPRMNGIEMIRELKQINEELPIVIISAHNETDYFIDSIRTGVSGYILKPLQFEQFLEAIGKIANVVTLAKENLAYKNHLEDTIRDKTKELESNYQKLQEALTIDPTTGLPNQASLQEEIHCFGRDAYISMLVLDIDHFNIYNGSLGYEEADKMLAKIANLLTKCLPIGSKIFRESSDEFAVILPKGCQESPIPAVQQLMSFFKETSVWQKNDEEIYISFSVGVCECEPVSRALLKAHLALHEAKEAGFSGQYRAYEDDSNYSQIQKRNSTWIYKVRKALEEDRVVPYFQPIVSLETDEVVKYECLARLTDTNGDIIMPMYFLEPLSMCGLMGNLTRMLIKKSYEKFKNLECDISINIANEDMSDPTFIDFLIKRTELSQISPNRVVLEILEDIVVDPKKGTASRTIERLKEMGFKIAVDDFGAERSNFSRLEQVNCDIIKIDGQFVRNINEDKKKRGIVENIVKLAHSMGVEVIAEHVGTAGELAVLKVLGVDYGQGFLLGKPSPLLTNHI